MKLMKINYHNQTNQDLSEAIKTIQQVFDLIKNKKTFEIIFVDSQEINRLNQLYRQIDKPTDVLSFVDDSDNQSLGDVFICLDVAYQQAQEYEHTLMREVAFLAVHGYLHLIGYDHQNEKDEKKMNNKQKKLLLNAGIRR